MGTIIDLASVAANPEDYMPPEFLYGDDSHIILPKNIYRQAGLRTTKYQGGTSRAWNISSDMTIDVSVAYSQGVNSGVLPNTQSAFAGQPFNVWLLGNTAKDVLLTPIFQALSVSLVSEATHIQLPQALDGATNPNTTKATANLTSNGSIVEPCTSIPAAGSRPLMYTMFDGNLDAGSFVAVDNSCAAVYNFSSPKAINKLRWYVPSGATGMVSKILLQLPNTEGADATNEADWTTIKECLVTNFATGWTDYFTLVYSGSKQSRVRVKFSEFLASNNNPLPYTNMYELELIEDDRAVMAFGTNQLSGYQLVKASCDSLDGTVFPITSNTAAELVVSGDVTSEVLANDYFRLAPPQTQACLYLGTIIFDSSGHIIPFVKNGWTYTYPIGYKIDGYKTLGTPALVSLFKAVPPHAIFVQLLCLIGDSTSADGFGIYLYDGSSGGVAIPAGLGLVGSWTQAFGIADFQEFGADKYWSWSANWKMRIPSQIYNAFACQRSGTNAYPLYAWFLVEGYSE